MAPSNPPFPLSGKKSFALTQKISNSQSPRYLEFRGFGLVPLIFLEFSIVVLCEY